MPLRRRRGALYPRTSAFKWIALLATGSLFPATVGASYTPVHLWKCVQEADVIVAGTVHSITPRDLGAVVSEVHLRKLTVLRGGGSEGFDTLVIRVLGGMLDGRITADFEGPKFHERERHILLLKGSLGAHHDHYTPVVFLNQGMFPVMADSGDTTASVRDWLGRPIVAVHDGRIVSLDHDRNSSSPPGTRALTPAQVIELATRTPPGAPLVAIPPINDPGTRLNEAMFLDEIRKLMRQFPAKPEGQKN